MAERDFEPNTPKGRATRDRIIRCAAELLVQHGVSALSMAYVCKAAAVSGSQITHYFADKQSLMRAVISHQTQAILNFHCQPALGNLDTMEDFERWAELTLRFSRRHSRARVTPSYGPLYTDGEHFNQATYDVLDEGQRQWAALLEAGLQRMKQAGRLTTEADPRGLALVLICAYQGSMLAVRRRSWPNREALDFALGYLRMFATDGADPSSAEQR